MNNTIASNRESCQPADGMGEPQLRGQKPAGARTCIYFPTKKASLPQRHREMGQKENCKSEPSDLKKSPCGVLSLVPKKAGSQGFRIIQRVVREAGRYGEFSPK